MFGFDTGWGLSVLGARPGKRGFSFYCLVPSSFDVRVHLLSICVAEVGFLTTYPMPGKFPD